MTASNQDDLVVLRSEVRIRRCGLETKLIIPNAGPATNPGKPNGPMVKAIVRANLWQEKLLNERGMTVKQIAIDEKKTEPYVRRFLPLTSLAPDIVEAILDGRHPADLTLGRLTDEITLDWTKQRRAFGFTNGQPPSI
jgi:site-specific DNA recombinase